MLQAMKTVGQRITYLREEVLDLTQEEFAAQLGVSRGAVGNWERDKPIARKSIEAIVSRWNTPSDWLLTGKGRAPGEPPADMSGYDESIENEERRIDAWKRERELDNANPPIGAVRYKDIWLRRVPIRGDVAAGSWLEPSALIESPDSVDFLPTLMASPGDQASTYALRVRGTSINKLAADGDLVICHSIEMGDAKSGDLVVVERVRDQGGLRETTVKRYYQTGAGAILQPESSDPLWQNVIQLKSDSDDDEVRIIGVVAYILKPVR